MSDIEALVRLHEAALEGLSERVRVLEEQEAAARAHLDVLAGERRILESERAALAEAEKIYRRMFGWSEPSSLVWDEERQRASMELLFGSKEKKSDTDEPQKIRARIGPQRFQMFTALKSHGPLSIDEIVLATDLPVRRVKDQMTSDLASKNVSVIDNDYQLTDAGLDLLNRFIEYKRSRGEPLPPLMGGTVQEDREEGEDDANHQIGELAA